MKYLPLIVFAVLVVVACNANVNPTVCPDGNQCYAIDCGSVNSDLCWATMGRACPNGYDTIDKDPNNYYFLIRCHGKSTSGGQ